MEYFEIPVQELNLAQLQMLKVSRFPHKGCSRKKCKDGHRLEAYLNWGGRGSDIIQFW